VTCPLSWQAASRPSCRRRACPVHCQTVRPCCKVHCVHHHLCVSREASPARQYHTDLVDVRVQENYSRNSKYYNHYIPGPTCRGSAPLYAPSLSYKRGGKQRYKGRDLDQNLDLDPAQADKFIRALKLNTSHSGVGYYAPVARTTLNTCVFLSSSFIYQQAKRLSPLLVLGFRASALCHPAEEFPLRHLARQVGGLALGFCLFSCLA
jgi:hypothetical protein